MSLLNHLHRILCLAQATLTPIISVMLHRHKHEFAVVPVKRQRIRTYERAMARAVPFMRSISLAPIRSWRASACAYISYWSQVSRTCAGEGRAIWACFDVPGIETGQSCMHIDVSNWVALRCLPTGRCLAPPKVVGPYKLDHPCSKRMPLEPDLASASGTSSA